MTKPQHVNKVGLQLLAGIASFSRTDVLFQQAMFQGNRDAAKMHLDNLRTLGNQIGQKNMRELVDVYQQRFDSLPITTH